MGDFDFGTGGAGGDVSAKTASAATAYSMIVQAINAASVYGGYKIAEVQGVFAELAPLLDPALDEISSAKISEAFDNAADANSLASSSVFRDLVNGNTYLDDLGRASAELSQYYDGYDIANMALVRTTEGDPSLEGVFAYGAVFNADRTAIYYGASNGEIGRRVLSEPGNVLSAGAETKFSINTLYGGNSILSFDVAPDESRMLIADNSLDDIYEVIFTTPGDLSTATVGSSIAVSNVPRAVSYNRDGTAVWYYNTQSNQFARWPLSTPYDFSTRGSVQASANSGASHPSGESYISLRGIHMNEDETKIYLVFGSSGSIYEHWKSGPSASDFDFTLQDTITLPSAPSGISDIWFSSDDLRDLWVSSSANDVLQYTIPPTELQAPA